MGTRRRRSTALAVAVGMGLAISVGPLQSWAAPPEDTFELAVSPTEVEPGGQLDLEGTCYSEVIGTAQDVFVRLARRVPAGSGLEPYSVSVSVPVDATSSTFAGVLEVPLDAPPGDYRAGGFCRWDDQAIPVNDTAVVVLGDPAPPTTGPPTTDTGPTTTAPPPSTAPPATAVEGEARLTG